jgi:hypothetical protein
MTPQQPPILANFPAAKQERLDELLERNAEQSMSPTERTELESLVAEAEALMVANAKLLADFASHQSPPPPAGAVPVTVWIAPQTVDR